MGANTSANNFTFFRFTFEFLTAFQSSYSLYAKHTVLFMVSDTSDVLYAEKSLGLLKKIQM